MSAKLRATKNLKQGGYSMRNFFGIALASGIVAAGFGGSAYAADKIKVGFFWKALTPLLAKMGNEVLISP
jgi:hypothetical protein